MLPYAYNARGLLHTKQGDFDAAIDDFNRALAISPNYAEARKNREFAQRLKNGEDVTTWDDEQASELSPDPDAYAW